MNVNDFEDSNGNEQRNATIAQFYVYLTPPTISAITLAIVDPFKDGDIYISTAEKSSTAEILQLPTVTGNAKVATDLHIDYKVIGEGDSCDSDTTLDTASWSRAIPRVSSVTTDGAFKVCVIAGDRTYKVAAPSPVFIRDTLAPTLSYTKPTSLTAGKKIPTIAVHTSEKKAKFIVKQGTTLPPGLSLHTGNGEITGTPNTVNLDVHLATIVITDAAGNTGEHTITFPTVDAASGSSSTDTAAPTVTFTPTHNETTTDNAINITLTFNEPVRKEDGNAITADDIVDIVTLVNNSGVSVEYTGSITSKVITLNPDTDLPDGTYTITLLADTVEDVFNNAIPNLQTASFTVDTTAPTVTFTPTHNETTTDNAINITLAFNEPVRKEDGNAITVDDIVDIVTLVNNSGVSVEYTGSIASKVITLDPDTDLPDGTYTITLLAGTVEDVYDHVITDAQGATFTVDTLSSTPGFALANEASDGYINNSEKDSTETIFSPLTSTRAGVVVSYAQSTASSAGTDACSSATFSYTLTAPPAINTLTTDGTYYFCARTTDSGAHTYGNKRTVIRDTVAPTGTSMSAILSSDTGVTGDDITNDTTPDITLSGLTGDDATTARLHITLTHSDGTEQTVNTTGGNTTVTAPTLKEGRWDIVLQVSDAALNPGKVISFSLIVDTTAPSVSYTTKPTSLTVGISITPVFPTTGDTDIHRFAEKPGHPLPSGLSLDPNTGAVSGTPVTANADAHTATIAVTDKAGNTAEVSVIFPVVDSGSSPVRTVPEAPQGFTVTPGNREVTLSWSAPANNGGASITKYRYAQKEAGSDYSDYADIPNSDGSTITHTFTSLTNDVAYSFKICAHNVVGCGTTVEATAIPSAPGGGFTLANWASDGYINDSEKESTRDLFTPLIAATVGTTISYAKSTASSARTDACSSATFSYTLTAPPAINTLTTDGTYYFCARTTDPSSGAYIYGNKRTVIRDTVAPKGTGMSVSLSTGNDITNDPTPDITLSGLTGDDATTARLHITLTHSDGTERTVNTTGGNTTVTAPTLKEGIWTILASLMSDAARNPPEPWMSEFLLTVDTTNPSVFYVAPALLTVGTPITPMSPTVVEANPIGTGGLALKLGNTLPDGLLLNAHTGDITGIPLTVDTNTHTTTIVVTDAAGNTGDHTITFPTVDAAPVSPPAATAPGVPQNFTATAGDREVILSWQPPANNGGAAITKYRYIQKTGNNAYSAYADVPSSDGATTSHTFTLLTNDVAYRFKICAHNSAGCGTETREQTATPRASIVAPSDTTAPTVTFFPRNNTTVTNNTTDITLQFNETVRKINDIPITSNNAHTLVTLTESGSTANLATQTNTTFSSNTITINPSNNLTNGTYTITLLANTVEDTDNNAITLSKTATFIVAAPSTTSTSTRTRRASSGGSFVAPTIPAPIVVPPITVAPTIPTSIVVPPITVAPTIPAPIVVPPITNTQLPPPSTPKLETPFTRDLVRGSTGEDVRKLQEFLNKYGYHVAQTGPGSLGKETTTFGPATENALKAFQTAHNFLPFGALDSPTRNRINLLIKEFQAVHNLLNTIQNRRTRSSSPQPTQPEQSSLPTPQEQTPPTQPSNRKQITLVKKHILLLKIKKLQQQLDQTP